MFYCWVQRGAKFATNKLVQKLVVAPPFKRHYTREIQSNNVLNGQVTHTVFKRTIIRD